MFTAGEQRLAAHGRRQIEGQKCPRSIILIHIDVRSFTPWRVNELDTSRRTTHGPEHRQQRDQRCCPWRRGALLARRGRPGGEGAQEGAQDATQGPHPRQSRRVDQVRRSLGTNDSVDNAIADSLRATPTRTNATTTASSSHSRRPNPSRHRDLSRHIHSTATAPDRKGPRRGEESDPSASHSRGLSVSVAS